MATEDVSKASEPSTAPSAAREEGEVSICVMHFSFLSALLYYLLFKIFSSDRERPATYLWRRLQLSAMGSLITQRSTHLSTSGRSGLTILRAGGQKQSTWGQTLRAVYTFDTVEDFWWCDWPFCWYGIDLGPGA